MVIFRYALCEGFVVSQIKCCTILTCMPGFLQSLRTIIEQGLDPNMDLWVGSHKTTLLSLACEYGQERLVNMIISEQTGLRIDCQDESGKTPLMVAAKKGLKSVVDILIERCV